MSANYKKWNNKENLYKELLPAYTYRSWQKNLIIKLSNRKIRNALISYEDKITDDAKLGLWGFSYDALFDNDKVPLTDKLKQKIIDNGINNSFIFYHLNLFFL